MLVLFSRLSVFFQDDKRGSKQAPLLGSLLFFSKNKMCVRSVGACRSFPFFLTYGKGSAFFLRQHAEKSRPCKSSSRPTSFG